MATARVLNEAALRASLALPRTSFPMRANAAVREHTHIDRITTALYRRHLDQSKGKPTFILHDGPPYANGSLHMGHALNKVLKDIINRRALMGGARVVTVPGWDCHGLPIELKALSDAAAERKAAGLAPAALSPVEIRAYARRCAERAIADQRNDLRRWGILGDWNVEARESTGCAYVTMDPSYEAAQLRVFRTLVEKRLVHRSLKPVYWSPSTRTALAEAELEYMDNHKSPSVYVAFPFGSVGRSRSSELAEMVARLSEAGLALHAVIWTTTPWTLPANVAICVNPTMMYSFVQPQAAPGDSSSRVFVVATERLPAFAAAFGVPLPTLKIHGELPGEHLEHAEFAHPLAAMLPRVPELSRGDLLRVSRVLCGTHVTADSGTGLVHTAPGHGHDDFDVVRAAGAAAEADALPILCPVDGHGKFIASEVGAALAGKDVQADGTAAVIEMLSAVGALLSKEDHVHRYPYDWRSKKPIIIRATEQWFIDVGSIIPECRRALSELVTVPPAARTRLDSTVGSRTVWCISRQRAWGVPIPVFFNEKTGETLMTLPSIDHVVRLIEKHGADVWWSADIRELLPPDVAASPDAANWTRGLDTLDVWFDSGSAWAATWAGAAGAVRGDAWRPSDVVLEGSDQHRGWFQSSLLTSIAVNGDMPYKTLVTHGFVLDEHMRKMSKSLGNVVLPSSIIDGQAAKPQPAQGKGKRSGGGGTGSGYGADVLRYWVASSDYTKDVVIGPAILATVSENIRKLRNTARYMLSNLPGILPELLASDAAPNRSPRDSTATVLAAWQAPPAPRLTDARSLCLVDQLMLHRIADFSRNIDAAFGSFAFMRAISLVNAFVTTDLSSQFFDFSKDRLYADPEASRSRRDCQLVMWEALRALVRATAPITVFTAEDLFQHSAQALLCSRVADVKETAEDEQVDSTVFDLAFPAAPAAWHSAELGAQWDAVLEVRAAVNKLLEQARADKHIGSSSEARVRLHVTASGYLHALLLALHREGSLESVLLCSQVDVVEAVAGEAGAPGSEASKFSYAASAEVPLRLASPAGNTLSEQIHIVVEAARGAKCTRCWKYRPEVSANAGHICHRCTAVLAGQGH